MGPTPREHAKPRISGNASILLRNFLSEVRMFVKREITWGAAVSQIPDCPHSHTVISLANFNIDLLGSRGVDTAIPK